MNASEATVLVTGATGLVGQALVPVLKDRGYRVLVLSRSPDRASALFGDLACYSSLDAVPAEASIDAIIHLAGEPVADKLWSESRKTALLTSRTEYPTRIGEWMERCARPPRVWLNASAIGWYGTPENEDERFTEADAQHSGFAAQLCGAIEASAENAVAQLTKGAQIRLVQLRIGLVLAPRGGFLAKLAAPVKLFAGAVLGHGRQWQSWIHIDDTVRAILHCLETDALDGPVNLTAPEPVRASAFMSVLGKTLRRPVLLKVPAVLLRLVARDMADDLLLASQRVLPQRLVETEFSFQHPDLEGALQDLLVDR